MSVTSVSVTPIEFSRNSTTSPPNDDCVLAASITYDLPDIEKLKMIYKCDNNNNDNNINNNDNNNNNENNSNGNNNIVKNNKRRNCTRPG